MVLPGAENAIIDDAKLRDYLLSHEHPVGRFKAAFFGTLGYTQVKWTMLRRDLLHLVKSGVATDGQSSPFGRKFEVRGTLNGPSGRHAEVMTVWVILVGETLPRFVTAFPG